MDFFKLPIKSEKSYRQCSRHFVYGVFSPHLLPAFDYFGILLLFTSEPRAAGEWFHSHFDNVMTQFIINNRVDV